MRASTYLLFSGGRAATLPTDLPTAIVLRWDATPALTDLAGDLWREEVGGEAGLPAVRLDVKIGTVHPTTRPGDRFEVLYITFFIYAASDDDARAVQDAIYDTFRPGGSAVRLPFSGGRLALFRPATNNAGLTKYPDAGSQTSVYEDDWVAVVTLAR